MLVTLEPVSHIYSDEKGLKYKSVSSLLSDYKHPFEPHKVTSDGRTLIENYTLKHGGTEKEHLKAWEDNKNFACDRGHAFHSLKELIVANQPFFKVDDEFLPVRNINQEWLKVGEGNFHLLPPGVYTEVCLWNYPSRTAGTADLLIIYPGKKFRIKDYKTNGEFRLRSYKDRTMKFPFIELPDCHIGHYTVQLSAYAWMLIQFGYECLDLEILHYAIDPIEAALIMELGVLPDIQPTSYMVDYLEQEILTAIELRKDYLNQFKR